MADDVRTPGPLPTEALAFFRAKGLKPSFDYREVWGEEHALSFTVAKMTQMDLLQQVQDSLTQALTDGQPFAAWKKSITPALADAGWLGRKTVPDPDTGEEKTVELGTPRRLATIYDTNMRGARAAGQWERIQRTKQTLPYLLWQLGPSKHHRDQHVAWNGTLLPADDPFWDKHTPPCGYGCKCWLRQVSKPEHEELTAPDSKRGEQLGIKTSRPADWDKTKLWVNKRSGEELRVPVGVMPGFDNNPAKVARSVQLQQAFGEKMKGMDTPIVKAAVTDLVKSPAFDLFLRKPRGSFPVAAIEAALAGAIEAKNAVVMLPDDVLIGSRESAPEITDEIYSTLPAIIHDGMLVQERGRTLALLRRDGVTYAAELRADDASATYTVSAVRQVSDGELARIRESGKILRDWRPSAR